jgi:cell division protein FtsW
MINMAVNLNLMPPKGMTLPFVSYGGSSLTAVAIGMGMLLALSRKRPDQVFVARPRTAFTPRTA